MMIMSIHSAAFLGLLAAGGTLCATPASVDFAAKIAPLFQEHCIDCHAADEPDGDFNMESFEALMKGGKAGAAVIAGNAQDSLLVKFLEGRSGKEGKNQFMPPGKKEHLSTENIALIRQWIDAGALPPAAAAKPVDLLANLPKIKPTTEPHVAVQSLAYSDAAKVIASGTFGSVLILDARTRQHVRKLEGVAGKVNGLVFSADGTMLFAAAGDAGVSGIAYQWKVSDGSLVQKFEGHIDALYALALSPDGKVLATGSYDQKIKLWDIASGRETGMLKGHNGGIFGLSFRPDGRVLASASADRTVKLWEVTTGKRLDTFSQPLKEQTVVAFSPDGKNVAAGGADNRIRIWTVSAQAIEGTNKLLTTRFAHEGAVLNLAYAPDGKALVSTAADRTVKIWNAADVSEQSLLEKQPDWAPALTILEGGKVLLGRLDGSLGAYELATGNGETASVPPATKTMPPGKPELLRFEPRGLQSGVTTRIKVYGKNLAGLQSVKSTHDGVRASIVSVSADGAMADLDIFTGKGVTITHADLSLVTPGGETIKQKLLVDDLPQIVVPASPQSTVLEYLPINAWGTLKAIGQLDNFRFKARKDETTILDLAVKRVGSKAASPRLEVFDANGTLLESNNGLDSGSDPFLAFKAPADGEYTVRVREITLGGSSDHAYRLTIGVLPYVTGWWPLSVPVGQKTKVHLVGYNLREGAAVEVSPAEKVDLTVPLEKEGCRSRVKVMVTASDLPETLEAEPNDTVETAGSLTLPASINGRLHMDANDGAADTDLFRINAEKGQELVIETRAATMGSTADTKVEVLDAKGHPVAMTQLQATKDSWLTLRSEDANDPAIRLGQFSEMDLNEYMYFNGEVVKIFRLARGPDADMVYYANGAKRRTYLNTSPAGHGLDDACYVVEPKPVGATLVSTGLPVFTLFYANDDDGARELGSDSRLMFTAPEKGVYHIRVSDTRGWSGDRFSYRLIVRPPQPGFIAKTPVPARIDVPSGSGAQFSVNVERVDGWDGEVRIDVSDIPPGFYVSSPLIIQAGHLDVTGSLYALPEAKLGIQDFSKMKMAASGTIDGTPATQPLMGFAAVNVTPSPKKLVFMEPAQGQKPAGDGKSAPAAPYEITIAPGGTVSAWLRVDRHGDDAIIPLDVEGLPHGVIVDNIGLNGVQIRAGENDREIELACAKWVPEQDRLCHVVVGSARNDAVKAPAAQTGFPVLLKVRKPSAIAVSGK